MVFRDTSKNRFDEVVSFGAYQPKRGGTNPLHDNFSKNVLALKNCRDDIVKQVIQSYDEWFSNDIVVVAVPSGDPLSRDTGIMRVARGLAALGRIDATHCLVRTVKIAKLATGGDRSLKTHLKSIAVVDPGLLIWESSVLLLDDVCTTENSLLACKQLLMAAGALEVQCVAIAQTV